MVLQSKSIDKGSALKFCQASEQSMIPKGVPTAQFTFHNLCTYICLAKHTDICCTELLPKPDNIISIWTPEES